MAGLYFEKELAEFMKIVKKVVIIRMSIKEYRYHNNLLVWGFQSLLIFMIQLLNQIDIPNNGQITFNTHGNITPAGFVTHVPGTTPIIINQMGTYLIIYEVFAIGTPSSAFALFNGNNQIAGSNYGGNSPTTRQTGEVITTLNAMDVLTLRSIDTTPISLLNTTTSGSSVISASIVILRLA